MAVEFGWRRFIFFDKSFVMDTSTGEKFVGLKDVSADSWCKLGETVFLGERRGGIFRLNQQFQDFFWKPFQRSLVDLKCSQGLLFSAGEDDDTGSLLKIWHKVTEDKSELFKSVRFSSISAGLATAATAIGVHSSLTEVVAGFGDGSVLMFQGDVIKDKMDKTSRWLKLCDHNSGDGPVEGIAVSHLPGDKTVVFVIYTKALYSYVIENRVVSNRMKHFSSGANRDCWAFNERLGQLAIANKEMVYLYDAERSMEADGGHGRCYKLGGGYEKMQLVWFGEYLVLLTKQQAIIAAADEKFMSVVTIYDIKTQYVAFSCSLPAICRMFVLGSNLMVLNDRDGTLSELKEKTLAAKLEILYKKQFFDVALSLAKSSKEAKQHEQAIHCKFADHLYAKGDFDNAIDHYKGTIGMLEPSYVMKKFHDESRLHQLCVYLEGLHEKNVYNRHQTEILLQTYARLGDNDKLLSFVEKMAHFPDADLPTAFQILRSAGLSKKASFLAIKLKLPQEALACMIEDEHHYRGAIKYIDNLSTEIAVQMLEKHGKVLLEHSPKEAIPLLEKTLKEAADSNLELAQFLAPYYDQLAFDSDFVQFLLKLPSSKTQVVIDRLLEIRLRKLENVEEITDATDRELFQLADAATPEVALQLVRIFRCSTIEKHVMQSNNWWKELAKFLLKHGEINELIEICKVKNDAQMWQETMICIAQRKDITEYDLRMFLQEVERSESLHPLLVLEVLSGSETIKISAVKPYIINWLKRQNEQIEKNTKAVEDAENRMREITQQAESLKFEPQVIQVSKCSACDTALQLPAVHFLCHHSYHVHCFESYSDRADHCPACVSPATVVQSDSTDNFFNSGYGKMQDQLNSSVNGMEIVAQFIRRGLFNNQKKLAPRQSIGSNPFASTRQNSDSGSSQAEPAMARRPTRSNNPFEELPSPRRNTNNPFDGPDQTKPKGSNPFKSSNPFDE